MQNFEATPALNPNQLISNRYRLQQFLGRGAFGQVYAAEDTKFVPPKRVAIKIISPEFLGDAVVREDVRREAGVMARFNHPNILHVLDYEVTPTLAYIVTDLAGGGSLASRIQPDPTRPPVQMPLPEVINLLEQIGSALDEAHTQGLVHRDIKPQNILIDSWGRPLLADFGLATALNGSQKSVMVMATTSGTPPYMAPEQWTGQAGRASDIYALGVLAYQLITGKTPYQGNQFELMGQHLNSPVPPLSANAPGLIYPPELDQAIAQAMEKNPHNRIKSALEFARRLKTASQNSPASVPAQPQPPAPPKPALPVTEVFHGASTPPANPPATPEKPADDPLRAETQVVSVPPLANLNLNAQPNPVNNAPPPNYNQNAYQPPNQPYNPNAYQPPQPNQAYNPNPYPPNPNQAYNPQGPGYYLNQPPARPRNNNNMYLIGGGVALVVVLIVVVIAVALGSNSPGGNTTPGNNGGGKTVSNRTSLHIYPNSRSVSVPDSVKQSQMDTYQQQFNRNPHDAQYFASPDNGDQIANFFKSDAQGKGVIQGGPGQNGVQGFTFVDASTGDVVVIDIYPPQVAQSIGLNIGNNYLIEIID
ncbi:MAG: serine/threonine protein kinase [Chloroflexi bacterium]|nr:serine/threonine protein kinase [Chloroflexota bacterium]OJV91303.1 MAG: hypothetical protein BGO39_27035 [Chloroflexi bacterium 54-19]